MLYRKLFFLLFILNTLCVFSQKYGLDEPGTVISEGPADTVNIISLINKAREYQSKNQSEAALNNGLIAYGRALGLNYSDGISRSLEVIFQAYYSKSDYKNALTYQLKYLALAEKEKNRSRIAMSYKKIALIYQEQEHYQRSLKFYYMSYNEFLALSDSQNIAGVLTNKGLNYYQLTRSTTGNKSDIYLDSALLDLNTSLKISKNNNYPKITASNLGNLSEIYTAQKKYNIALDYSLEAIDNYKKIGDVSGEATSLFDIGKIYEVTNENNKALEYYQKSLKIAIQQNNKYLETYCYMYLASVSDKIGDYKSAYNYHKTMALIKDSLINIEDLKQINEMQTKYETEKTEALNKLLTGQNELSAKTIKQQKTINYFIVGGLIMAIIFSFFIFNGLKKQRNANVIISKQKKDVEFKNSEIEKQKALVEEKQKEILDSIHYAKRIQTTILPHAELITANLSENFIYFKPKDIVSGDFYWATVHNNIFYLAVCDSTGHGVPGAFMSILNIGFLSEAINEKNISEPDEILNYVRKRLVNSISKDGQQDGFDGILICFDRNTNTIAYSAANNAPVLVRNNQLRELAKDKMPVGKGERTESFSRHEIQPQKGDSLYLYTDGYADQFGGPNSKKFMYKQLNDLLLDNNKLTMFEQKNILDQKFEEWKGDLEQIDDVCVIGFKL